ncbi:MAG TPA: hypothetical protein VFG20_07975 [Planctomycetaceae bacterium]|nr:hypothetical protein [Planctomycetaceae bacterium]
MKSLHAFFCLTVVASLLTVAGCGAPDPAAGIPKEKLAPPATELGKDPEYVKQFSKKK